MKRDGNLVRAGFHHTWMSTALFDLQLRNGVALTAHAWMLIVGKFVGGVVIGLLNATKTPAGSRPVCRQA